VNGAMGDDIESSMLEHFRTGVEELSVSALERLRRGS